jgi:hypothetical protein
VTRSVLRFGVLRFALRSGWVVAVVGCGGKDLPGHYWDVVVTGQDNQCTGNAPDYTEQYEYRVVIAGNDIEVAIGPDVFALGTIEACSVQYSSLAWSDYRDDKEIQWEILGEGRINLGNGAGCVADTDWEGTETFLVTNSAHPDVSSGCTYTLSVTGTYKFEVE